MSYVLNEVQWKHSSDSVAYSRRVPSFSIIWRKKGSPDVVCKQQLGAGLISHTLSTAPCSQSNKTTVSGDLGRSTAIGIVRILRKKTHNDATVLERRLSLWISGVTQACCCCCCCCCCCYCYCYCCCRCCCLLACLLAVLFSPKPVCRSLIVTALI